MNGAESIIIIILSSIIAGLAIVLFFSSKEKNRLRKDREKGLVDRYTLLANFENTVKKIMKAKEDDPAFGEEFERKYFEEMSNLITKTNLFIDFNTAQNTKQLKISFPERFLQIITLAKLWKKNIDGIEQKENKKIDLQIKSISGALPFVISSEGILFEEPKFENEGVTQDNSNI